jgi:hypothetical protein
MATRFRNITFLLFVTSVLLGYRSSVAIADEGCEPGAFCTCTAGYQQCTDCPSCASLCTSGCGDGWTWNGEGGSCNPSGPYACDPHCNWDQTCYQRSCGCKQPKEF